jgi:hypothetical protein
VKRVVDKLKWKWRERQHRAATRAVLDTPAIVPTNDGLVLFSMMGTRVLLPYLVAVKSLHARLQRGRIVILDDGTLTAEDRAILAAHLGNPQIMHIADVETGPCPRGGTWERLLTILDLRGDNYVIQLDSDTITLRDVPELVAAIADNRSFTLLGSEESTLQSFTDAAARREKDPTIMDRHVQTAIESRLDRAVLPDISHPRYVRGCSGFAGFARGGHGRPLAEAFSSEATRLIGGGKWAQWGSEQVTSNMMIANDPDPVMLRYDRYRNFWDDGISGDVRFMHFLGSCRFIGSTYADTTRAAIAALHGR